MQLLRIKAFSNDGAQLRTGVVVMYRVSIKGRWLPWVSNANPERMRSVQQQYNLGGSLDTASDYAGNPGETIDGVEIRAFRGETNDHPVGDLPGAEYAPILSYMTDRLINWRMFRRSALNPYMDGIKIQTSTAKPYYLSYKSWNAGNRDYYPVVKSTGTAYNDYAGYPGKTIQLLHIDAYRNDGVQLKTGVVVMYRVHVDNRWLPWVSNAELEWMRKVHAQYNLDGTLDTESYYAGNKGQNINGVEIRIFEENGTDITPTGKHKIVKNVPFITQLDYYPTGCESVSTVMALKYAKVKISVDTFIDKYLDKKLSGVPFDPMLHFGGDPRSKSGFGCYSPVILKALLKILEDETQYVEAYQGKSLSDLCSEFIDKNIPVILWATQDMDQPYKGKSWTYDQKPIQWISPMHCLLLVGYDENHYIFNDPLKRSPLTYYNKSLVERAYEGLYKQVVVVKEYARPKIPTVPKDATPIKEMIGHIKALETEYLKYYVADSAIKPHPQLPNATDLLKHVLGYLRAPQYGDWQWFFTTGSDIDKTFINYVETNNSALYNYLNLYIKLKDRKEVTDGNSGVIDFSHMAATIAGYIGGPFPSFWAGWGADLATGMLDTTNRIRKRKEGDPEYQGMTDKEIADNTIGNVNSTCNYSDFCSDFDAFKVQERIKELSKDGQNYHLLSEALQWYYKDDLYNRRYVWIAQELGCTFSVKHLSVAISNKMKTKGVGIGNIGFITVADIKGGSPTQEVFDLCCNAYTKYIYSMMP